MGMRMPEVAEQAVVLEHWPHAEHFSYGEAIPFMEHTIRAHPGEVVLLTIAPLTNVAALFASDEDLPHLLKGIVSMCGLFTRRLANVKPMEYNAGFDPYATAIVYRSKAPMHRSVGLDVTKSVTMDAREFRKRFQVKQLQPVLDFAEVWFQRRLCLKTISVSSSVARSRWNWLVTVSPASPTGKPHLLGGTR